MHALIMAGGLGSRLNLGEKPLVMCGGRPMISYVVDAYSHAGYEPVVAVTARTPMTQNWCRAHEITCYRAKGKGYIEDMIEVVTALDDLRPLFVSVSDIPCLTPHMIETIYQRYIKSGKDACSTWVPVSLVCHDTKPGYCFEVIDNVKACPVGVNILTGDKIRKQQDELQLLISDPGLALNVNTRTDLMKAESFIRNGGS
jgi:adenosylcobinamide-phosphate guanylyltransferase